MATLLIGYDLNAPGKDYSKLIERIKALGAWWHHLDSTWLVKTSKTPSAVRDELKTHMDANDEADHRRNGRQLGHPGHRHERHRLAA